MFGHQVSVAEMSLCLEVVDLDIGTLDSVVDE